MGTKGDRKEQHSPLYARLLVDYYEDAALLRAGEAAELLYVRALCYAKRKLTDGYLTDAQVRLLGLEHCEDRAAALVREGLWARCAEPSGYEIVAYLKYNPSRKEVESLRAKRKSAGRVGARSRWGDSEDDSKSHGKSHGTCYPEGQEGQDSSEFSLSDSKSHSTCHGKSHSKTIANCTLYSVEANNKQQLRTPVVNVPRVPLERAREAPDEQDAGVPPDDPDYQYDSQYQGEDVLGFWEAQVNAIPKRYEMQCRQVLQTLHASYHRSPAELVALAEHVASNAEARQWWGGKHSHPGQWRETDGSGKERWQKIAEHMEREQEGTNAVPSPVTTPELPKRPKADRSCQCKGLGKLRLNGQTYSCPHCALGRWRHAHIDATYPPDSQKGGNAS